MSQPTSPQPTSPKGGATMPKSTSGKDTKHFRHNFVAGRLKQLFNERQKTPGAAEPEEVAVEIHYYSHSQLEQKSTTTIEDIVAEPPSWASVAWINVDGLSEPIIKKLATEFDLHPIAVEDVVEIQHRPKLDFFNNSLFMITSIISKENGPGRQTLVSEQVSFFLVGRTLITIQQGLPGDVWEGVRETLLDQDSIIRNSDTGFLLYALLGAIVDTCKPIVDELDEALEDLEVAMMENPSHKLNKMVYSVKRHQITLRSILFPTRKMLNKLLPAISDSTASEDSPLPSPNVSGSLSRNTFTSTRNIKPEMVTKYISEVSATYFRDMHETLSVLCDQIEQQKEVANSLNSLYAAHQDQLQGQASYVIAIVSVFFLPLSFVAGLYGMNFDNMPELHWHLGYMYCWMIFIGIVLFEIVVFNSVGWIEFKIVKRLKYWLGKNSAAGISGMLPSKYYKSSSLVTAEKD